MFVGITSRFEKIIKKISGTGRLSDENIKDTLREVRKALLEADVALDVTKTFIEQIRKRALGQEVAQSLSPGQALIKIVHQELVQLMGAANAELNLNCQPPAVILLAGLQGSGKTTTAAKLAHHLKTRHKHQVLLVSTDVYRPAAIEQLATLAKEIDTPCFASNSSDKPSAIVKAALEQAKRQACDVVIIDSAGRLHIDTQMMAEISELHRLCDPIETLFVVDSMTGQDAANTAAAFNHALALTGVILTKTDGDARGGAALSIRSITGKPIKFIGVSEKIDGLEAFHPERIASRILGMGDILSLIEEAHHKLDQDKAKAYVRKLEQGKSFTLDEFRDQMLEMNKLGSISQLLDKLPGMGQLKEAAMAKFNDKSMRQTVAIINSMTKQERRFPDIIRGSRKRRIAQGSGTQVQDINRLLKQFAEMQKMTKKFAGQGNMTKMLRQMQGILPPGGTR